MHVSALIGNLHCDADTERILYVLTPFAENTQAFYCCHMDDTPLESEIYFCITSNQRDESELMKWTVLHPMHPQPPSTQYSKTVEVIYVTGDSPRPTTSNHAPLLGLIVDFQDKQVSRREDEEPLAGGPEAEDAVIAVQAGHLLLGNLAHLPALLPVEEHRVDGRRLPVDKDPAQALAQGGVGEIRGAGGELPVALGCLDIACRRQQLGEEGSLRGRLKRSIGLGKRSPAWAWKTGLFHTQPVSGLRLRYAPQVCL